MSLQLDFAAEVVDNGDVKHLAPHLQAYLEHGRGASILERRAWERARSAASSSGPSLLAFSELPFGRMPGGVCATVERLGGSDYHVRVFREDLNDVARGGRYNVYDFQVYEGDLPTAVRPDVVEIAERCSTSYNQNCRAFVAERAVVEPQPKAADHWIPDLPDHVKMLMAARSC